MKFLIRYRQSKYIYFLQNSKGYMHYMHYNLYKEKPRLKESTDKICFYVILFAITSLHALHPVQKWFRFIRVKFLIRYRQSKYIYFLQNSTGYMHYMHYNLYKKKKKKKKKNRLKESTDKICFYVLLFGHYNVTRITFSTKMVSSY